MLGNFHLKLSQIRKKIFFRSRPSLISFGTKTVLTKWRNLSVGWENVLWSALPQSLKNVKNNYGQTQTFHRALFREKRSVLPILHTTHRKILRFKMRTKIMIYLHSQRFHPLNVSDNTNIHCHSVGNTEIYPLALPCLIPEKGNVNKKKLSRKLWILQKSFPSFKRNRDAYILPFKPLSEHTGQMYVKGLCNNELAVRCETIPILLHFVDLVINEWKFRNFFEGFCTLWQ